MRKGGDFIVILTDTGIGVAPQHPLRLTERLYRIDRDCSRDTDGTGLRLAIVKRVLTRHGTPRSIVSERGGKSTNSLAL